MPYYWLIAAAFIVTWIAIASVKKRLDALALAAPLPYVYQYELHFTKRLVHEVLKLTPEEYEHLKPAIENPIYLKIEFWRGHLVLFLSMEGVEQKPWSVYVPSSKRNPLTIWEKRFAAGEDDMFDFNPAVPRLRLHLTTDALQLAVMNGRFGKTDSLDPKPEHVFMNLTLSRPQLADYRDDDPDAHHYRPFNVSEYRNHGKDELMMWSLRIFHLEL